jgi:hypothetical protein
LQPKVDDLDFASERRTIAREIRAIASIDVDAMIASGELIRKATGWCELKDMSVLAKVGRLLTAIEIANRGNTIRVKLESVKKYEKRAAKLRPDV